MLAKTLPKAKFFAWFFILAVLFTIFRGLFLLIPAYLWGKLHGITVTFSPTSTFSWKSFHLRYVQVRSKDGELIFSAKELSSRIDSALLLKREGLHSLSGMKIENPILFFHRDSQGKWHYSHWTPAAAFASKVEINGGTLSIFDEWWKQNGKPSVVNVTGIHGTLDFSRPYSVRLHLQGAMGAKGGLRLAGSFSPPSYSGIIQIKAEKLPLAILGNYLFHDPNLQVTSGTLRGSAKLFVSGSSIASMTGESRVLQGSLISPSLQDLPVTQIMSTLVLQNTLVKILNLDGKIAGNPFTGHGLAFVSATPRFSLLFKSPQFNLNHLSLFSKLIRRGTPSGLGDLSLKLSGDQEQLLWEGELKAAHFSIFSIPMTNLQLDFSSMGGNFFLERAGWQRTPGYFLIRGISTPNNTLSYFIQGEKIPISDLSTLDFIPNKKIQSEIRKAKGLASFSFLVNEFHGEKILAGKESLQAVSYHSFKIIRQSSHLLSSKEGGWLDDFQLVSGNGTLTGNAAWTGRENPFVSGEFKGRFKDLAVHPFLFGKLNDSYLIDRLGVIHWAGPSDITGIFHASKWPLTIPSKALALQSTLSGLMLVHVGPQNKISAIGAGGLSQTRFSLPFHLPVPFSEGTLPPVNWSLGFHQNQGSLSAVSPGLALFGRFNPGGMRSTFMGEALAPPFTLFAAGNLNMLQSVPRHSISLLATGELFKKEAALSTEISQEKNKVQLHDLQAVLGKSLYTLNGNFLIPPDDRISLKGFATNGEISDLTGLLRNPPFWLHHMKGKITGNFSVSGPREHVGGDLHLFVRDGSLFGEPISTAYLDARLDHGTLYFDPLVIRSFENYLTARGRLGLNGLASFTFDVPQIYLSNLESLKHLAEPLEGFVKLHGKAAGPIVSPAIWANIEASHFQANRLRLDKIYARAFYENKTFRISEARFINGLGDLGINADVALSSPPWIKAQMIFSRFNPESLLSWRSMSNFGLIDGRAFLQGPLPQLDGSFDFRLSKEGSISGQAQGTLKKGIASFSNLNLKVGDGEVSASGQLNVNKPSTFNLQGSNLDIDILSHLFHWQGSPAGKASFKGDVRTSLQNPEMDLEFTVAKPSLKGIPASSFSGRLIYKHGELMLQNGQLVEPHGSLVLNGFLPLSLKSKKIIRAPLSLRIKLENQDLKILSDIFPSIEAGGLANADFNLVFDRNQYAMTGEANLRNGKIKLPGLLNEIEHLEGSVHAGQNAVDLDFTGSLTNPFQLTGNVQLQSTYSPQLFGNGQLRFTGSRLFISTVDAQVHATPDLLLSRQSEQWKLSGTAAIDDGAVDSSLFSNSFWKHLFPKLGNLELDTQLNISRNLNLHHPHLEVQGGGSLKISGTVSNPQLSGELSSTKGTVVFLGTSFTLTRGLVSFSPGRKLPYLNVEGASTRRIQGSKLFIRLTGYPGDIHLDVSSDPPLTQNELLATLTQQQPIERYISGGRSNQFIQQEASRWLSAGIAYEVFYPLEKTVGSAFNLEYFSFQFLPTGQLGLQVGKDLGPHLAVTYTRAVAGRLQSQADPGAIWGVEYHLSPKILFRATQDNLTGFGGQILSRWNF